VESFLHSQRPSQLITDAEASDGSYERLQTSLLELVLFQR
jgi:hypothetical protein